MAINAKFDKERGVLVITADNESRAELAEANRRNGYRGCEDIVAEAFHEYYEFVSADDIPYALTSAPFLVDCDGLAYPDNGEVILYPDADIFIFADYAVRNEWLELRTRGRVEWEYCGKVAATDAPRGDDLVSDYLAPAIPVPVDPGDYMPGGAKAGQAFYVRDGLTFAETPEGFANQYESPDDNVIPGSYVFSGDVRFGPYEGRTWKGRTNLIKASGLKGAWGPEA